jgi:hypothetical protein
VDDADRRLPQLRDWSEQQALEIDVMKQELVPFDEVFTILVGRHAERVEPREETP